MPLHPHILNKDNKPEKSGKRYNSNNQNTILEDIQLHLPGKYKLWSRRFTNIRTPWPSWMLGKCVKCVLGQGQLSRGLLMGREGAAGRPPGGCRPRAPFTQALSPAGTWAPRQGLDSKAKWHVHPGPHWYLRLDGLRRWGVYTFIILRKRILCEESRFWSNSNVKFSMALWFWTARVLFPFSDN